jgi:hypothetical protein
MFRIDLQIKEVKIKILTLSIDQFQISFLQVLFLPSA